MDGWPHHGPKKDGNECGSLGTATETFSWSQKLMIKDGIKVTRRFPCARTTRLKTWESPRIRFRSSIRFITFIQRRTIRMKRKECWMDVNLNTDLKMYVPWIHQAQFKLKKRSAWWSRIQGYVKIPVPCYLWDLEDKRLSAYRLASDPQVAPGILSSTMKRIVRPSGKILSYQGLGPSSSSSSSSCLARVSRLFSRRAWKRRRSGPRWR